MSWHIKDGGYPYIDGVETAESFRLLEPAPTYAWNIIDGGYSFLTTHKTAGAVELTEPYPKWVWKSVVEERGTLFSSDYPVLTYERKYKLTPVKQPPYICVFDMRTKQEDFGTNGLRILSPTACKITQELNGQYELILEHPMDDGGAWEQLIELNIIKAQGQLFTIYRIVHSYTGSVGKVTVYARHIFYQLADRWIQSLEVSAADAQHAIEYVMRNAEAHLFPEHTSYDYTGTSDIETPYTAELDSVTLVGAIMGTESTSIFNQLGGELYRDNFRFSLNKEMEGAAQDAFYISVGFNLIGITRDIDYSNFCTWFKASDNWGNSVELSYSSSARFAHNTVRGNAYKYEVPNYEQFLADAKADFAEMYEPKITYKVSVKDVRNNPDYQQLENITRYKVGDWGTIYDVRLGISTRQKIIRSVVDAITGEVTELTFGNLERSLTRPVNKANIIATKSDIFAFEQQKKAELKTLTTWEDLSRYTWAELKKFTWGELSGKEVQDAG